MRGAELDNSFGTGGVVIKNSRFNDNSGLDPDAGLYVNTNGAITLSGVTANDNAGFGARLINTTGTLGVTITNGEFNSNGETGLYVRTNGAITISTGEASTNSGGLGADLDNDSSSAFPGVTISNGTFYNNYTTGLRVYTRGNIILSNTASWENNTVAVSYGAVLDNTAGTGYVKITNQASTDTDLKPGFDLNHDRGLDIFTNGTVTLTNVNMLNNQEEGMRVWLELNKGVTMTNCRVDGNVDTGIVISTIGPVSISGGHANDNGGYGAGVHNYYADDALPKPVTIKNFAASGNFGYGIFV